MAVAGRARPVVAADMPAVAGASDLRFVLPALAEGAPFELFLSADEAYVSRLADPGLAHDRGLLYAIDGSPLRVGPQAREIFRQHGFPVPDAHDR